MMSNTAVNEIIQMLDWSDLPRNIGYSMFPIPNTPSANWSCLNRTIMFCFGTCDARGIKQWENVMRYPVRGARNIYIVAPQIREVVDDTGSTKKEVTGWSSVPVISIDQTYGDPFDHQNLPPKEFYTDLLFDKFKLQMRAKGISKRYQIMTHYDEGQPEHATCDEKQFFWNIALGQYKELFNHWEGHSDRIHICELAALALLRIVGKDVHYQGRHMDKLREVARVRKMSTIATCFTIIKAVEKILNEIFKLALIDAAVLAEKKESNSLTIAA